MRQQAEEVERARKVGFPWLLLLIFAFGSPEEAGAVLGV